MNELDEVEELDNMEGPDGGCPGKFKGLAGRPPHVWQNPRQDSTFTIYM